jgi:hypothetical protein
MLQNWLTNDSSFSPGSMGLGQYPLASIQANGTCLVGQSTNKSDLLKADADLPTGREFGEIETDARPHHRLNHAS